MATIAGEQAIGTLKVGEKVWAYNTQKKQMEYEPIVHVWVTHDNDLVDLTLTTKTATPSGKHAHQSSEAVHTNKKHPFLTVEKGFLPVEQLKLGMHVIEADGRVGEVTGWKSIPGAQTMYNLEVTQDHTYTVGTGQWVVHNSSCSGFKNESRLSKHFNEHGDEFDPPFKNAKDYEKADIDFMSGDQVADTVREASIYHPGSMFHGDLVRFDEATNIFGNKSAGGVLKTFYPAQDGIEEFYKTLSH